MIPCQRCGTLLKRPGLCAACRSKRNREINSRRGSSTQQGYDSRWARESKLFLRAYPLCVCKGQAQGCDGVARVVDHRIPHKGDQSLFWNPANWQPMSKVCHDRKTATEDGGFGRSAAT